MNKQLDIGTRDPQWILNSAMHAAVPHARDGALSFVTKVLFDLMSDGYLTDAHVEALTIPLCRRVSDAMAIEFEEVLADEIAAAVDRAEEAP